MIIHYEHHTVPWFYHLIIDVEDNSLLKYTNLTPSFWWLHSISLMDIFCPFLINFQLTLLNQNKQEIFPKFSLGRAEPTSSSFAIKGMYTLIVTRSCWISFKLWKAGFPYVLYRCLQSRAAYIGVGLAHSGSLDPISSRFSPPTGLLKMINWIHVGQMKCETTHAFIRPLSNVFCGPWAIIHSPNATALGFQDSLTSLYLHFLNCEFSETIGKCFWFNKTVLGFII